MKYLKTINEYLSINKETYGNWLFGSILNDIKKMGFIIDKYESGRYDTGYYNFYIDTEDKDNDVVNTKIMKIINKWDVKTLEKDGLIIVVTPEYEENYIRYDLIFKEVKIKRVKPFKYVYHQTDNDNVDSILKNGLYLKDSENWDNADASLKYPPCVFASNVDSFDIKKMFYKDYESAILKIDTTMIPNKWWKDLNMGGYKSKLNNYIMTFEPIPPSAISLM